MVPSGFWTSLKGRLLGALGMALGALMVPTAVSAQQVVVFDAPNATMTMPEDINDGGVITGWFFDSVAQTYRSFIRTPDGQFTVFDVGAGFRTYSEHINASGTVAGLYRYTIGYDEFWGGFVRAPDGQVTTFPTDLGYAVNGINDLGQIVGRLNFNGFLREADGQTTPIIPPNADGSNAPTAINNNGEIAGYFRSNLDDIRRLYFRSTDGTFTAIDPPNNDGVDNGALGINSSGLVAGWFGDVDTVHGFLWEPGGQITVIDAPNSLGTIVGSLNDAGEVAGAFLDSVTNSVRALVRSADGLFTVFDAPNAVAGMGEDFGTYAAAMNNGGSVTGMFDDEVDGRRRGFLYTPASPDDVVGLVADLAALVASMNLKMGIANSFDAKLAVIERALAAAQAGDALQTCGMLGAFLNEVAAQAGMALTVAQAAELTDLALQILSALGC